LNCTISSPAALSVIVPKRAQPKRVSTLRISSSAPVPLVALSYGRLTTSSREIQHAIDDECAPANEGCTDQ
jgi:hypothetical protein